MTLVLVVACALLDRDGRVLLARRPMTKRHGGLWEFPGGKVEPGEAPERALVRELREELTVEPCERCLEPFAFSSGLDGERHIFLALYACRRWDGFARPQEGQELTWAKPQDLHRFDMPPLDVPLASAVADRLYGART